MVALCKKKPVLSYELFFEDGGEGGGLTRCARPAGSLLAGSSSVQLAAPVVEPRTGVFIPPGKVA
ncbi:hypothetical protein C4803_00110 [Salmonella enterica subsp. arizonae serovar 51:g,z51:-]|nr:hypothetical protein C4803_00110 [Salmonella enterica subsp. arizonae serovar 51:g,z51:-]